jgi:hypothetical protein
MSQASNFDGILKPGKDPMEAGQATKRLDVSVQQRGAHQRATSATFPEVVETLVSIIGRRLTAYIASVKDARAIDRWLSGVIPQRDVEYRLRLAYRVAVFLSSVDSSAVVKAWLVGLNPELDDQVPIKLLRDGDLAEDGKKVLGAAMAFVTGG